MTIISVRGTSGSGKTHLVRAVWGKFKTAEPTFREGRKRPIFYALKRPGRKRPLYVLGSYETVCGGCDTIKTADEVFELIEQLSPLGDVMYEGLLLSGEVRRSLTLPQKTAHHVFINLPLEKCLSQVNSRRRAKDPEKPDVNPDNTASKHRSVLLAKGRLDAAKVNTFMGDYDECLSHVLSLLRL